MHFPEEFLRVEWHELQVLKWRRTFLALIDVIVSAQCLLEFWDENETNSDSVETVFRVHDMSSCFSISQDIVCLYISHVLSIGWHVGWISFRWINIWDANSIREFLLVTGYKQTNSRVRPCKLGWNCTCWMCGGLMFSIFETFSRDAEYLGRTWEFEIILSCFFWTLLSLYSLFNYIAVSRTTLASLRVLSSISHIALC